jgi:ribosomal protein S18
MPQWHNKDWCKSPQIIQIWLTKICRIKGQKITAETIIIRADNQKNLSQNWKVCEAAVFKQGSHQW